MKIKLKEVCSQFLVPMRDKPKIFGGIVPWCRIEDIQGRFFNKSIAGLCVSDETIKNMNLTVFPTGTVICSCSATLGAYAINTQPLITNQTFIGLVCDESKIYNKFLFYYMSLMTKKLSYISIGTTIPYIPRESFENLEISLPSLDEQHAIADKLWAIDDKIENNKKIYDELNSVVRDLYNYWFLQFEFPYKGGTYVQKGGEVCLDQETNKKRPLDWKYSKIGDCIVHVNTGLNPRKNFVLNDGLIKYVTVKNLTPEGVLDFAGCDTISEKTKAIINKRSLVTEGDILFASIAPLGRCYLIRDKAEDWEINESVFSIRPNTSIVCPEYLYLFLTSEYFIKKSESSSTGSVFNGIRISTMTDMYMLVPSKDVMNRFKEKVSPLFKQMAILEKENRELNDLKNFLLPQIVSGKEN